MINTELKLIMILLNSEFYYEKSIKGHDQNSGHSNNIRKFLWFSTELSWDSGPAKEAVVKEKLMKTKCRTEKQKKEVYRQAENWRMGNALDSNINGLVCKYTVTAFGKFHKRKINQNLFSNEKFRINCFSEDKVFTEQRKQRSDTEKATFQMYEDNCDFLYKIWLKNMEQFYRKPYTELLMLI